MAGRRLAWCAVVLLAACGVAPAAWAAAPAPRAAAPAPTRSPGKARPKPPKPPDSTPAQPCDPRPGIPRVTAEPWAQKRLGFERVWPITTGRGVVVAVIDSGVATRHPVFAGRSLDVIDLSGTGTKDCTGHGTGVAAIIGARRAGDFSGVAPSARLVIVKQQNAETDEQGGARLPRAIRAAVDRKAEVINISISTPDSAALREAVRYAQRRDVVIVAAAGNVDKKDGTKGPAYPASYTGVLSVASLGSDGALSDTSSTVSRVDLGAPGREITTAWPGGGYTYLEEGGTSYATPYVAGVAALVRAHHRGLSHRQVIHRILATADGGMAGSAAGRGMVNPMRAVTAVLPEEGGAAAPALPVKPVRLAAPPRPDRRSRDIAVALTGGAIGAAGLAAAAGVIIPLGRRRGWRPGRTVVLDAAPEPEVISESPENPLIGGDDPR